MYLTDIYCIVKGKLGINLPYKLNRCDTLHISKTHNACSSTQTCRKLMYSKQINTLKVDSRNTESSHTEDFALYRVRKSENVHDHQRAELRLRL